MLTYTKSVIIHARRLLGALLLIIAAISLGKAEPQPAYAAGTLSLEINATPSPPAGGYPSGTEVQIRVGFSCSVLNGTCGDLDIVTNDFPMDNFEFVQIDFPPEYPSNFVQAGGNGRLEITKTTEFEGGDAANVTLTLRTRSSTQNPAAVTITATGTLTDPIDPTPVTDSVTIPFANPTFDWSTSKTLTIPSAVDPTVDQPVTYEIEVCPASPPPSGGNIDLTNVVITDVVPDGAEVVSPAAGGNVTYVTDDDADPDVDRILITVANHPVSSGCLTRRVVLRYPTPTYNIGDMNIVNTASAVADQGDAGSDTAEHDLIGPLPNGIIGKNTIGSPLGQAGTGRFRITIDTSSSNTNLDNAVITDILPTNGGNPVLDIVSISTGAWNTTDPTSIQVSVVRNGNPPTPLTPIGTGSNQVIPVTNGDEIEQIIWTFTGPVPPGFTFSTQPEIVFQATNNPGDYTNNVELEFDESPSSDPTPEDTDTSNVRILNETANIDPVKTRLDNNLNPGETVRFRLTTTVTEASSTNLTNLSAFDLLPSELAFVSWDSVDWTFNGGYTPVAEVEPNFLLVDDYNGTGRQALLWTWDDTVPAGSVQLNGDPGVPSGFTLPPPNTGESVQIQIQFTARVNIGVPPGNYPNTAAFLSDTPELICQGQNNPPTDADDFDQDGNIAEPACSESRNFRVIEAASIQSSKWIQGNTRFPNIEVDPTANTIVDPLNTSCPDDGTSTSFTRTPCVAQQNIGGTFTYKLRISNTGNVPLANYFLYDVLPYIGDTGSGEPLATSDRFSQWQAILVGEIVPADAFTTGTDYVIEYATDRNACRNEVSSDISTDFPTGCDPTAWTTTPGDFTQVEAFRIRVPFATTRFLAQETMEFLVPMQIPTDAGIEEISWNSFAQRANRVDSSNDVQELLTVSEPPKVGILVRPRNNNNDDDDDNDPDGDPPAEAFVSPNEPFGSTLGSVDWGDLPESFTTTSGVQGPSHPIVAGLRLGSVVDAEPNGQPSDPATGDGADEDGVTFPELIPGTTVTLTVRATNMTANPAFIQGWMDLNGNGAFEPNEQIATDMLIPTGTDDGTFSIDVFVPADAPVDDPIYSRFRISTQAGLGIGGPAPDGEVEDYVLGFLVLPDTGGGRPPVQIPAWAILAAIVAILASGATLKVARRRT